MQNDWKHKKNFTAYSFKYILNNKKMKLPVNKSSA